MKINVKPLGSRIIVQRLEAETKTAGGIIIPDSAKEKPQECTVVAVGEGSYIEGKLVPVSLKVGEKVLVPKWGGVEIKIQGGDFLIFKEEEVLAVFTN